MKKLSGWRHWTHIFKGERIHSKLPDSLPCIESLPLSNTRGHHAVEAWVRRQVPVRVTRIVPVVTRLEVIGIVDIADLRSRRSGARVWGETVGEVWEMGGRGGGEGHRRELRAVPQRRRRRPRRSGKVGEDRGGGGRGLPRIVDLPSGFVPPEIVHGRSIHGRRGGGMGGKKDGFFIFPVPLLLVLSTIEPIVTGTFMIFSAKIKIHISHFFFSLHLHYSFLIA